MDKTAVIVLHYKGEADTKECLNSILAEYFANKSLQIIVVVNLADTSFCSLLEKEYPQIVIIKNQENTGFALGNNIGLQKALELGCKYMILLNNDTLIGPGLLDKLTSFAGSDPSFGIVSPKIYFAKGYEYHKDRYKEKEIGRVIWYAGGIFDWANILPRHRGVDEVDKGQYNKSIDTDFATGCCMLITKDVIDKVGFFDEKYFLYFEDIDLSVRARKNGFRVVYFPDAYLWHKNASSSGKPGSKLHLYYQTRNRLYFGYKYSRLLTKKALFLDSLKLLLKRGVYKRAVLDYFFGKMGRGDI